MTILNNYWNNLQINQLIFSIFSKAISISLLIIAFFLIKKGVDYLFNRAITKAPLIANQRPLRKRTLTKLIYNGISYAMYFFLLYWILTILGVPVSSLLAGAGIAGVAIGLGAQGFLSDVVNGFFILLENQFDVGEFVEVGTLSGTVSNVGIRTTQIRDWDGVLHFIPNRNITTVSNQSRGFLRAKVDIPIYADVDLDQLTAIVKKVNQEQLPNHPAVVKEPHIFGVVNNAANQLVFRIHLIVENDSQLKIPPIFFKHYQKALLDAGIILPTPAVAPVKKSI